jgi:hypothetical protein
MGGAFPNWSTVIMNAQPAVSLIVWIYHSASGAVYAKLLMGRATRWPFLKHWARRVLGDSNYHHHKLLYQSRGAVDYWRSARATVASEGLVSSNAFGDRHGIDAVQPD